MPLPAELAYIDPGSGTFLVQVAIAAALGLVARVAGWFTLHGRRPVRSAETTSPVASNPAAITPPQP